MTYQELQIPPDGGISSIHFDPDNENQLCTTSWAGNLLVFSVDKLELVNEYSFPSPLLCSAWVGESEIVCGAADGKIYTRNGTILENHDQMVTAIGYIKAHNVFFSASLDGTVCFWNKGEDKPHYIVNTEQKIIAGFSNSTHVVVCTSKNLVFIVDYQNRQIEKRISSLQMQIRAIAPSKPEEDGWAVSSIDGRIAIEYFGDLRSQAQRFAFHSHRKEEEEKTIVYPINALAFHPIEGTLASACSGGMVNFWDLKNKRRLQSIPFNFETSVSAIEYSPDGKLLAIAASYMWDKGDIDHPSDRLILYNVLDENSKPENQEE